VTGTLQRRLKVWLAAVAAALICWKTLPGTALDRAAFTTAAKGFANPPFFISGNGSHENPWKLRTFGSTRKPDTRQAPVIVSLGDDVEGFFQSSPPSPIDMAVILTNFLRLGAGKAATAGVLAWDAPDPIGLAALDKAIGRFDSLVMAAPLSRGAVPEQMPPAFRNASVAMDSIHGDPISLPAVNRIPLPGVILGQDNTMAGFQNLDSEPISDSPPLMARWEDRVVFAFPLLTVLQRLDLTVDGMEIRLGEYLKLSPNGPIVPIDRYGRLAVRLKAVSPYAEIPAEDLIDGGDDLFPKQAPEPVVLRDDRSAAEPPTRAFSKSLPAVIAAISSDTGLDAVQDYPRLSSKRELIGLSIVALVLAAFCGLPAFPRNIAFLTIAAACLASQLIGAGAADLWLPGIPALAAVLCAFAVSGILRAAASEPKPVVVRPPKVPRVKSKPAPVSAPVMVPESPAKPAPKTQPARKAGQSGKKRRR
jgi:hypothetical protein